MQLMCLRQYIDGNSKSLSHIDMDCGQTLCATSVWISVPTKYCEILSDVCAVWRRSLSLPPSESIVSEDKQIVYFLLMRSL